MATDQRSAQRRMAGPDIPTATETVAPLLAPVKPRMRGQLHAWAAAVSVATGAVLITAAGSLATASAAWSTAIYATAIVALFATSGLYHRRAWTDRGRAVMKRLDHSMIFVLIAGTYTPIAVLALPQHSGVVVLWIVWGGAAAGIVLKMIWPTAPRWIGVPLYIGLGWTAVFVFPEIAHGAGVAALVLIVVGGAAYTLGALTYALKRPDPYPATFGFHELFHSATIVAATCHYLAIWLIVF